MGSKRGKSRNIVNRCILRQTHGSAFNARLPRSYLQPTSDLTHLCIPLCKIQKDNSFALGHVLLGFTKCGEYLMSYYKELQHDGWFGLPMFKYTLHWWKFDMAKPLQQVSHISLFGGEVITEDLLLLVCHSLNDNRILVHGCAYPGRDEQCRQSYVTICPCPPGVSTTSPDDTWVAHMKYNLSPPFPVFMPHVQLKLKDTIILNTVDSVLAITVSPCAEHETTKTNVDSQTCRENIGSNGCKSKTNCMNSSIAGCDIQEECTEKSPVLVNKVVEKLCINNLNASGDEGKMCMEESVKANKKQTKDRAVLQLMKNLCGDVRRGTVNKTTSVYPECSTCSQSNNPTETSNCDQLIIPNVRNNNEEVADEDSNGCNKLVKGDECSSDLTSFSFKTFSVGRDSTVVEDASQSTVIDGTSYLDIQITTVADTPYNLLECLQDDIAMKDHATPSIHTRALSFNVERYINEALNTSDQLKGKYWLLKNYSTLLVDVCEGSQCVVIHVVVLISVQDAVKKATKREISSFSLLLTWCIATGKVHTLNFSPFSKTTAKTDGHIFKEGCNVVADLQKKYFVPSGLYSVQTFSNHNVLAEKTLQFIRHPFQPVAIVL